MSFSVHITGVGGIGVSAVARYYLSQGWRVTGSDAAPTLLTEALATEGVVFFAGENPEALTPQTTLHVYSEAALRNGATELHPELARAKALGLDSISYPVALARITRSKRLVAVAGSHGKSTTTAMLGVVLQACGQGSVVVGTQVPQFLNRNCLFDPDSDIFAIEACEYRRSFLQYRPEITVITNVDVDHLDYYKDEADYVSAFQELVNQTGKTVVTCGTDALTKKLNLRNKRHVEVFPDHAKIDGFFRPLRQLELKVPGSHLAMDANLAYAAALELGLPEDVVGAALESYAGSWRRSEVVRTTQNGNVLMSDYGHHPSEIAATLRAIKEKNVSKRLVVAFQPHQYSRTRELLDGFGACFSSADAVVISDIYESRDSQEDIAAMPVSKLVETVRAHHPSVLEGGNLEATGELLFQLDGQFPGRCVIVLLGAGNIDDLRNKLV